MLLFQLTDLAFFVCDLFDFFYVDPVVSLALLEIDVALGVEGAHALRKHFIYSDYIIRIKDFSHNTFSSFFLK